MASYRAIAAVCGSVQRLLEAGFVEDPPVPAPQVTRARVVRTEDFAADDVLVRPALSIYPYRIEIDRTTRSTWSGVGHVDGVGHLAIVIHLLLTPWASNADYELRILGRALAILEGTPTLVGPLLDPAGGFADGEAVHVVTGDITTEEIMRTFDSLPVDYRLSMPYLARVVRIQGTPVSTPLPVVEVVTR